MENNQEKSQHETTKRLRFPSRFGALTRKEKPSQSPRLDSIEKANKLGLPRIDTLSMKDEEIVDFNNEQNTKLISELAVKHAAAFLEKAFKKGNLEKNGDVSGLETLAYAVLPPLRGNIENIFKLATHDKLTGALNRVGLEWVIKEKLEAPKAVLLVDANYFKSVNDTFGHQRGDEVLKIMYEILIESLREGDELARIGGDEFVVILCNDSPESDKKDRRPQLEPQEIVEGAVARIKNITDNYLEKEENKELIDLGFGIAVGGIVWEEGVTYEEMLKEAEERMKENKEEQHEEKGNRRKTPASA